MMGLWVVGWLAAGWVVLLGIWVIRLDRKNVKARRIPVRAEIAERVRVPVRFRGRNESV